MKDVFVAFGRIDLERVNRILTVLNMRGYRVWIPRKRGQAILEETKQALRSAKCVVALWSSSPPTSKSVAIFAKYANEKGILINVLMDDTEIPSELDTHEALDLSAWDANEEEGFEKLEDRIRPFAKPSPEKFSLSAALAEIAATAAQARFIEERKRARKIARPTPTKSTVLPVLPAYGATTIEELIEKETRLTTICTVLNLLYLLLCWGIPLAACTLGRAIGLSDGWVMFWLIAGTVAAFVPVAVRGLFEHRRDCVRELRVFEESKSDPRPFCLLLRSFTDSVLGYGLYFTNVGDHGQRYYQGPVHFRGLADGLTDIARLIVLCRSAHEDAILRTESFEHVALIAPSDGWLHFFKYSAERCRAIIVVPGASRGLLEEVQFIRSDPSLLRKTLVFMPETPRDRRGSTSYFEKDTVSLAWTRIKQEWSKSGLNLPDYGKNGLLYFPAADFSQDRTPRNLPLSRGLTLKDIVSTGIPTDESMCSVAKILGVCESYGVMRIITAPTQTRERLEIAILMILYSAANALFWWLIGLSR